MKKTLIHFIVFFLLATPKLHSQKIDQQFKATFVFGPSFPVGNFGRSIPDSGAIQSAAKPGPAVALSFSYRFKHSHFGVEVMVGWQQNNVNDTVLAQSMSGFYPPGSQIIVKSDNWHIWKFLAGPVIEIPLTPNGKTSLEFGVVAGILKTTIPGYEFRVIYAGMNRVDFASRGPISLPVVFCYQVNAGLNYRITRNLLLNGNISFMHAAPVHAYTYYLDPPYFTMPVHASQTYPISSLNVLVGIAYMF
jgi:hypothetical protein